MLGETGWVCGQGKVGEQGGVAWRGGTGCARVGGGDDGGAGGKRGLGHVPGSMDVFWFMDLFGM